MAERKRFEINDPVYIISGVNGTTRRVYGHVVDTWGNGRIVDVRLAGHTLSWPYKSDQVHLATADDPDPDEKGINHVLC